MRLLPTVLVGFLVGIFSLVVTLPLSASMLGIMNYSTCAEADYYSPVEVDRVETFRQGSTINALGLVKASHSASLAFGYSGRVKYVTNGSGGMVRKGDVIALLDDQVFRKELASERSEYKFARTRLNHLSDSYRNNPTKSHRYKLDAQQQLVAAELAQIERTRALMRGCSIVAPFSGRLTKLAVGKGDYVKEGAPIARLYNVDNVEVVYHLEPQELNRTHLGQIVDVQQRSFIVANMKGVVDYVAPFVDQESGLVEVRASFKNSRNLLLPGLKVNLKQHSDGVRTQVIVPKDWVDTVSSQSYVWMVNEDGRVFMRQVQLGRDISEERVVVNSGLKLVDKVISSDTSVLIPGMKVRIL